MLQKIIICAVVPIVLFLGSISCCSVLRERKVEANTTQIKELIKIGDNIFNAKTKIEKNGFKITYGPDFPTDSKTYYLMIVDYGLNPNAWEKIKLAAGKPGVNEPIWGEIKADSSGKIISIR
tara:strand:- start:186 stop:551 length:366 start_codon:yes stop_codon:yes gene_type:complete